MTAIEIGATSVGGLLVDSQTRCEHYHGPRDVIAIRFFCCGDWLPCHLCHEAVADHPAAAWPASSRDEEAVLCGVCGTRMRIDVYLEASGCGACGAPFNPGCRLHQHLYFS